MKYKPIILLLIVFALCCQGYAATLASQAIESGIIFKGLDSIESAPLGFGMDFYLQRPCTSATDQCKNHMRLSWYHEGQTYHLVIVGDFGRYKDVGKINLDSIKSAPVDSEMVADGRTGTSPVFSIAPDSLLKCIGNVYIIKTGRDPRDQVPYYAKIKILSFTVRDSAKHEVEMGFLWACNISGRRDLTTTGLDTFNLETPTILSHDKGSARLRPAAHARPGKYSTFLMLNGGQGLRGVGVGGVGLNGRSGRKITNYGF